MTATIPGCIFIVYAEHVHGQVVAVFEDVEAAHDAFPDRTKFIINVWRITDSDLYVSPEKSTSVRPPVA